jgi:DNA-binding transcriptional regulator GbsR (MarR family)
MTKKEMLKKYNNLETFDDFWRSVVDMTEESKKRDLRRSQAYIAKLMHELDKKLRKRYPSFF